MEHFKELLAIGIFALWCFIVVANSHAALIIGAMIGLMTGSVAGYYFGQSKSDKSQPVMIQNDATNPVPVEPAS